MKRLAKALAAGLIPAAAVVPIAGLSATGGSATASADAPAAFLVGAAVGDFTPPLRNAEPSGFADPADCIAGNAALEAQFKGPRPFAFEEPYIDQQGSGHYDLGDPFVDCNGDGRWDGNFIGGGTGNPRYYKPFTVNPIPQPAVDPVEARAIAVRNSEGQTAVIEVVDQEGVFNTYQQRIRDLANDKLRELQHQGQPVAPVRDNIFISATHDESAPDSLGLGGPSAPGAPASLTSGTNNYFVDYMIQKSADAIVAAVRDEKPANIYYSQAAEPPNLRQCWSSYPYVDDQLMPTLQAKATSDGHVIATLASVSQHAETLGFNGVPTGASDASYKYDETSWLTADWPYWFRSQLETTYGGVGIEMAGSVGSVETPEVFADAVSRTPQQHIGESHPAGCNTVFRPPTNPTTGADETPEGTGYYSETKDLGTDLANSVISSLGTSTTAGTAVASTSDTIWGSRSDICVPLKNVLFAAAAAAGVFAQRQGYEPGCKVPLPVAPNGSTVGTSVQSQVAAFRIGDGEFMSLPGEIFPFTYLGSFLGPQDMPYSQYPMTPMLMAHMHTPYRFIDGLAEDMLGYVFPEGNAVGIPGQHPLDNQFGTTDRDRFGCGHSDDSESTGAKTGDIVDSALVNLLDQNGGSPTPPESEQVGRYVIATYGPSGQLTGEEFSRDPLGSPESLQCDTNTVFSPWTNGTSAVGVVISDTTGNIGTFHILGSGDSWMSLSGQRQAAPDRNTRGWIDASGTRHWLNVFPDVNVSSGPLLSRIGSALQNNANRIAGDLQRVAGTVSCAVGSPLTTLVPCP